MEKESIAVVTEKALHHFGHVLDDVEVFLTEDMDWKCSVGRFKELGREADMSGTGLDMVLKIRGTDQFFKRDDDAEHGWISIDPIQLDINKMYQANWFNSIISGLTITEANGDL